MQYQRPLIPPFWTFLLATAASLTLFLPAAISMNSVNHAVALEEFRPTVPQHRIDFSKKASLISLSVQSTTENVANAPDAKSHSTPLKKTKGSLSLQTAAIVGSSAAVAAANLAGHPSAPKSVRRFMQLR